MKHFLTLIISLLITVQGLAEDKLAPQYEDRARLLFFKDESGLCAVKSPADWARRVSHIRASLKLVMGPLPEGTSLPLELKIDSETPLRHYTRQHVSFLVEQGARLPGWLLVPHGADRNDRRPAMICLPGSSAPGKDHPAGLTSNADMAYAHELAERGYVCLVLDYPLSHTAEYKTDPYALNYDSATMKGIVNHRRGRYYMPRIKTVYGDIPSKIPFDFTEVLAQQFEYWFAAARDRMRAA